MTKSSFRAHAETRAKRAFMYYIPGSPLRDEERYVLIGELGKNEARQNEAFKL